MALTAVVHLTAGRLELARHPADGRVIAFDDADAAFAFAVSFEVGGALAAGTAAAPEHEQLHILERGVTAFDLHSSLEIAA